MNEKKLLCALLLLITGTLAAQKGSIIKELGEFNRLKVFDGLSVRLIKSDGNKAVVTGANTHKVAIVNNKGLLKIRMEIDKIFSGYRTFVDVYYTNLPKVIDANEDARIYSEELVTQEILDLRAQEGAEIELTCEIEQLLVKAITGGDIYVSGNAKNQDIIINTGGSYLGRELKTEFTTIKVNAGGNAEIYATNYVKADVKAGGTVKVFGDPERMDEKTVFGGTIERVE